MGSVPAEDRKTALDSLKSIIERRVNLYGVAEPVVQTARSSGDYRVIVELAGVTDVNEALKLIGKTAELSFREEVAATEAGKISSAAAQLHGPFQGLTNLSGRDLRLARPSFDPNKGEPIVELTFNNEGVKKWEELTKRNLNKRLAIFLDEQLLLAPTVVNVITDGRTIITGGFTAADTKQIATLLNSGALPAPVKVIEQRGIGATLGQESIDKSLLAGGIGLGIVALFMVANYGRLGLLADGALVVYALLVLAIFKLVPVTLTLAGIAGFILSIGMAVDANILIFERMKEEIRWGRERKAALELGFSRAFPSVRDSNASSLITCVILYWFGTGPVRGFAVTLAVGILVSLFTAITVTRTIIQSSNVRFPMPKSQFPIR
jgi:preprotein translocase subunit SecD